jgi:hypothetical protein
VDTIEEVVVGHQERLVYAQSSRLEDPGILRCPFEKHIIHESSRNYSEGSPNDVAVTSPLIVNIQRPVRRFGCSGLMVPDPVIVPFADDKVNSTGEQRTSRHWSSSPPNNRNVTSFFKVDFDDFIEPPFALVKAVVVPQHLLTEDVVIPPLLLDAHGV